MEHTRAARNRSAVICVTDAQGEEAAATEFAAQDKVEQDVGAGAHRLPIPCPRKSPNCKSVRARAGRQRAIYLRAKAEIPRTVGAFRDGGGIKLLWKNRYIRNRRLRGMIPARTLEP